MSTQMKDVTTMNVTPRPAAVLAMSNRSLGTVFSDSARVRLRTMLDLGDAIPISTFEQPGAQSSLRRAEIMLTGWGAPRLDEQALSRMPNLRAVVHTAGTIKTFIDDVVFNRGIRVTSSASANATPVAEYTVAAIVFGRKRAARFAAQLRTTHKYRDEAAVPSLGTNGTVVGLVGASRVGREVIRLLGSYDMSVLVYDPYLDADAAQHLGVELVSLHDLCRRSDVLSIHAPLTPSTAGMIGHAELELLPDGAVVINTARGQLIDMTALAPELVSGRLDAYLDVTDPEPLPINSPLYDLPNASFTPHIAGALGNEIHRLGDLAVSEVAAYVSGRAFANEVVHSDLERIA